VLNQANGRLRIFKKQGDFEAYERILAEGVERFEMRICGYCIMGNHWHLLLWPRHDGDLSRFMHWTTLTHTQRYHRAHKTVGIGHLYRGRYKSFPIQGNHHYLTVLRYIEANPLRAKMVVNASEWPWSSYVIRHHGASKPLQLSDGPIAIPSDWPEQLGKISKAERVKLLKSLERGVPFGETSWVDQAVQELKLESTVRRPGRPKKFPK